MKQIPDTNLVFVHITKTGGMSITRYLGLLHKSTDHFVAKDEQHLLGPGYVRFCAVRDPIPRFVSAYKYSVHMAKGGRFMRPVRDFILEHGLGDDINHFVRECQKADFPLTDELHFRPQIWWLKRAKPQIVMRLESIETDIHIVDRLMGREPQDFPHVNEMAGATLDDVKVEPDEKTLAFCRNLYREDINLLGYRRRKGEAGAEEAED